MAGLDICREGAFRNLTQERNNTKGIQILFVNIMGLGLMNWMSREGVDELYLDSGGER